ncbi:MAG TPA: hypothetical protein VJT12_06025 [Methyloceanibacter sp.]|jgi:hypothetical protein|nr:hypothetical protein [Methyloceanibacter sp.]
MGFYRHPRIFDPLDLEIIDRVYETAWARLEAREPLRDRERDREREEQLRKLVFRFAHTCKIYGNVDFDELSEMVIEHLPSGWDAPLGKKSSGSTPQVGA